MPLAATIEFPHSDITALFRQIDRAQKSVGKSLPSALKMAANSIARSAVASTYVSDKYREFHPVIGSQTSRGRQEYVAIRPYYARREKRFFAWNDVAAKESRSVKIGRRGLAKAGWRALASNSGPVEGGYNVANQAKKLVQRELHLVGDDQWIRLTNRIYYATDALKGGEGGIETAMARASRAMEHALDNQIARKMGAR